jgi:hypothetical protein
MVYMICFEDCFAVFFYFSFGIAPKERKGLGKRDAPPLCRASAQQSLLHIARDIMITIIT